MAAAAAFAFSAGMVATVNPCGFAMLPAYLSLFLSHADERRGSGTALRGIRVGLVVTAAFVATFVAVGAVFRLVTTAVVDLIPWAALVVGIALVAAGVFVLTGRRLSLRTVQVSFGKEASLRSIVLFGVAYAVASVSCTLPIFLSVVSVATTADSAPVGISIFAAYGLGMGSVLVGLAVAVATTRDTLVRRLRGLVPYVERIGGWILVGSGLFIIYYWTTLLAVDVTSDSPLLYPLRYVERVSAWFTNLIANHTLEGAIGILGVVLAIALIEMRRRGRPPGQVKGSEAHAQLGDGESSR